MRNETLNLRFRECDLLSRAGTTPESERASLFRVYDEYYRELKRLSHQDWRSLRSPFGRVEIGIVISKWDIKGLSEYFDTQAQRQRELTERIARIEAAQRNPRPKEGFLK